MNLAWLHVVDGFYNVLFENEIINQILEKDYVSWSFSSEQNKRIRGRKLKKDKNQHW